MAGTVATAVLLLENETTAPPAGAGAVSVTVVEAEEPPCTLVGADADGVERGVARRRRSRAGDGQGGGAGDPL